MPYVGSNFFIVIVNYSYVERPNSLSAGSGEFQIVLRPSKVHFRLKPSRSLSLSLSLSLSVSLGGFQAFKQLYSIIR